MWRSKWCICFDFGKRYPAAGGYRARRSLAPSSLSFQRPVDEPLSALST